MSDSPEEKSYWQGHRAGTARLAETQRELTTKLEECIGLHVLVDDLRAQVRTLEQQVHEAQGQYQRAAEANAKAQTDLANALARPPEFEPPPWAAFLRARLRLIHEWKEQGIPGLCSGPANEHVICDQLNHHDPGQIRLLMSTPVEPPVYHGRERLDKIRSLLQQTPMPDADGEGPTAAQLEKWAEFIHGVADALYDADPPLGSHARDLQALRAEQEENEQLKQQLKAMQSGDRVCWHCYDVLQCGPDHCEKCPTFNDCDVEGCSAPGCKE